MNLILKRDPVWLESLHCPNASPTLLLLGGDGQQVAVPAPLLLAASPLVRSILSDLPPPAYGPCFLSLPAATDKILHVVVDILATGAADGELMDKVEDVRQVFGMLGVTVSLESYQVDRRQADRVLLDHSDTVEQDLSEVLDIPLNEKNIKFEIETEDDDVDVKLCPKKFIQKTNLVTHIKSAHSQIKIQCQLCPLKFVQRNSLRRHIKSVHQQIKFSCNLCLKKFTQKRNLVDHVKSVHDQFKILCQFCPKKFTQSQSLYRHVKSVHKLIRFPCNICSLKFVQKRSLVNHVKSVHDQTINLSTFGK